MQPDIARIFGKYAGREVPMKEETRRYTVAGKSCVQKELSPPAGDSVLEELRDDADRLGLSLRVWYPGMAGTMELNPRRLNVHIEKAEDGKWRIAGNISIDGAAALPQTFVSVVQRGVDEALAVTAPLRLKKPTP
jgi:hypothetical protein